jgi:hypothetical protein
MTTRPATINFRLYPHATFSETQTLLDSEHQPVDLSGRTARMHIRRDRDDADPVFELTTENGGITLGSDGQITITVPASDTYPDLNPPIDRDGEMWFHDLLIITPGTPDIVDRLYQGRVMVFPGVTTPA